jgi:hypothetical protein
MPLGDELDLDQRDPRSGPHFHFPTPAIKQCGEGSDPQGVQFRRTDTEGGAWSVAFGIGTTGKCRTSLDSETSLLNFGGLVGKLTIKPCVFGDFNGELLSFFLGRVVYGFVNLQTVVMSWDLWLNRIPNFLVNILVC